ncbi:uncharacterized protein LOC132697138 [Cylas formicarius]|uniref:uncharacterized protein LOC132697138 n=1 Tax=Cylas formicarius TaxID=197179 RepID=UPI002958DCA1|nr:uncharacterized protein LOC132697138 [Cylas formicarius]
MFRILSYISALIVFAECTIPPFIKVCKKNDPNIAKCITDSIIYLRPKLKSGIPEINVPAIEPLYLDEVNIRNGPDQAKFSVDIIDAKVWGPSSYEIYDLNVDIPNNHFQARCGVPHIYFEGKYKIDINVLVLTYKGTGFISGNFSNYKFTCDMQGELHKKNGAEYLQFPRILINLKPGGIHLQLTGDEGDDTITRGINQVIRENSDMISGQIVGPVTNALENIFTEVGNNIAGSFPYSELFPENIMCTLPFSVIVLVFLATEDVASQNPFYYIKQCHKEDPNVNICLKQATNHLIANINRGIPELRLSEPEPILIDQIQLALGSGPDGYKATFRNIEAYGVSNCTVTAVRSDIDTNQFQFTLYIPKISATAKYESSGTLILIQASGGGNYWGEYDGVKVKVYLKGARVPADDDLTYLQLQQMKMDFSVKNIKMGVDGIHKGNSVLQAALNLFINSNSQELLKEMKPHLKKKLLAIMRDFVGNVLSEVPYEAFIAEGH